MIHYTFSSIRPHDHLLSIVIEFVSDEPVVELQLPAWRPGRYELGNFAKNVRDLKVTVDGNEVQTEKTVKDRWTFQNQGSKIKVSYTYFADELNAGSTYLDEHQMYVNPVNCCMYIVGKENEECKIQLLLPNDYEVATALTLLKKHAYSTSSFDKLVDSPFIASNSLQHIDYEVDDVKFHCWFQGEVKIDKTKLLSDFKQFSAYQIYKMGNLPVNEYHFLFQITPYKSYHGVEHLDSTVILFGPSYNVFGKNYVDLLGVSSHELFHSWNIKAIRPKEMYPYDFTKENYSRLGYVAEGVTTYIGDRALYESGVFGLEQYKKEVIAYLKRHYHNAGRWHYDVASSSFDTWLDGYVKGVPGRKVSIYTEGMLIAYICDMRIRSSTKGAKSLWDVMQKMYSLTKSEGYSEKRYKSVLEEVGECDFSDVFDQLVHGVNDFTPFLNTAFEYDKLKLEFKDSTISYENYGIKGEETDGGFKIADVLEHSSADLSGLVEGDVIVSINSVIPSKDFKDWLAYFSSDKIELLLNRKSMLKKINLIPPTTTKYFDFELKDL